MPVKRSMSSRAQKSSEANSDPIAEAATTLDRFSELPTELRLLIWEQALLEASRDRYILLYDNRVVPFRRFISPLLLASRESRGCARAFYHVKVNVHAVPDCLRHNEDLEDLASDLNKKTHWDRLTNSYEIVNGVIENYLTEDPMWGFRLIRVDLEQHWSNYVTWVLRGIGQHRVRKVRDSGPSTGAFYISPEHDLFLCSYEFGTNFCIDIKMAILEQDHPGANDIFCRHISAKLPIAACQQVYTSVYVKPPQYPKDCIFHDDRVIWLNWGSRFLNSGEASAKNVRRRWKTTAFPNLGAYYALEINQLEEYFGFLARLTDPSEVGEPLQLRKWIWQERDGGKKRVLVDEERSTNGQNRG
ncbi:hypothetical protein Daus18300_013582 [Diaporthe australafricana]|uniref:2EXR domain-containing protein n=1 Tax=Diaporthe australafricana TaxID=127596 RepID=A0ABR3VYI4_9PEZI